MAKVTVYRWKKWDIASDGYLESRRMATRPFVEKIGGVLIEGSGVEIDASDLEAGEQFTPQNYTPKKT